MKLLTVDVERPLPDIEPPSIGEQWVLFRLHGEPLGILSFATSGCTAANLARRVAERFDDRILRHLTADALSGNGLTDETLAHLGTLAQTCPQRVPFDRPSVTVAVCTRDGASRIRECLDSLIAIDYPSDHLELLVVDNAPVDDATRRLVGQYPRLRYVEEPRPGLDWARNRAILEARGDIVAFTDDDANVDSGWIEAIARRFAEEPEAQCVTGLVVPDAIDVEAHRLFEEYGGFGRGFDRRYFRVNDAAGERAAVRHGGAGKFGTGANMAFRKSIFARAGMFDTALDVGTPANGGGDLEMFFRVLKHGGALVYEPSALVRHRHRQTLEQLQTQLANHGIGFYSYLVRSARAYPDERAALTRVGVSWFYAWNVRRLVRSFVRPDAFPRDLVVAELRGSLAGLRRYDESKRVERQVLTTHGPQQAAAS